MLTNKSYLKRCKPSFDEAVQAYTSLTGGTPNIESLATDAAAWIKGNESCFEYDFRCARHPDYCCNLPFELQGYQDSVARFRKGAEATRSIIEESGLLRVSCDEIVRYVWEQAIYKRYGDNITLSPDEDL